MDAEIIVINKNNIWEITETPADKKMLTVKWIYIVKTDAIGLIQKLKVICLINNITIDWIYSNIVNQTYGVWYVETFVPEEPSRSR